MLNNTNSCFIFICNYNSLELSSLLRCLWLLHPSLVWLALCRPILKFHLPQGHPHSPLIRKSAHSPDPTCFPASLWIFSFTNTRGLISMSQFIIHFDGSSPKLFLSDRAPSACCVAGCLLLLWNKDCNKAAFPLLSRELLVFFKDVGGAEGVKLMNYLCFFPPSSLALQWSHIQTPNWCLLLSAVSLS